MTEQFKGKFKNTPEKLEDQSYKDFQTAMDEEERIVIEIKKVFETTPSREEAEKIILVTLAPKMDEAIKKSKPALDKWLGEMREK